MKWPFHKFWFEWLVLPLGFTATIHMVVWLIVAFVFLDLGWASWFWHRVGFTGLAVFIFATLIHQTLDNSEENSE